MSQQNNDAAKGFALIATVALGAGLLVNSQVVKPKPTPTPTPIPPIVASDIASAATSAIKNYSDSMAKAYREYGMKMKAGELKSLEDVHASLKPICESVRRESFRPLGALINEAADGATALTEAADGFERASNGIK